MNVWAWVRIALVTAAFAGAFIMTPEPTAVPPMDWSILAIVLVLIPPSLLFVIWLQYANPRSAPMWRHPTWATNPFSFREPLHFFHLAAYVCLAQGVGVLLHLAVARIPLFPDAFLSIAMGVGLLLGLRLCTVVFRNKMTHGA